MQFKDPNPVKKIVLGLALAACLSMPVPARNFAVPSKAPAITIVVPDDWKVEEIEYGYSAKSPDGDVFFSVESARVGKLDAMLENNNAWMKENKIKTNVPVEKRTMDFNGVEGEVIRYTTTDENGPTIVDFVLLPGGKNTMIMLTLWGSQEERTANAKAIDAIMNSVKPIN